MSRALKKAPRWTPVFKSGWWRLKNKDGIYIASGITGYRTVNNPESAMGWVSEGAALMFLATT